MSSTSRSHGGGGGSSGGGVPVASHPSSSSMTMKRVSIPRHHTDPTTTSTIPTASQQPQPQPQQSFVSPTHNAPAAAKWKNPYKGSYLEYAAIQNRQRVQARKEENDTTRNMSRTGDAKMTASAQIEHRSATRRTKVAATASGNIKNPPLPLPSSSSSPSAAAALPSAGVSPLGRTPLARGSTKRPVAFSSPLKTEDRPHIASNAAVSTPTPASVSKSSPYGTPQRASSQLVDSTYIASRGDSFSADVLDSVALMDTSSHSALLQRAPSAQSASISRTGSQSQLHNARARTHESTTSVGLNNDKGARLTHNPLLLGTDAEQFRTTNQFTGTYTCVASTPEGSSTWAALQTGEIVVLDHAGEIIIEFPPLHGATNAMEATSQLTPQQSVHSWSGSAAPHVSNYHGAKEHSGISRRFERGGTGKYTGATDENDSHGDPSEDADSPFHHNHHHQRMAPQQLHQQPLMGTRKPSSSYAASSVGASMSNAPVSRVSAMRCTPTHMLVGYSDGTVVFYDHLVIVAVTQGTFHTAPVTDFCVLADDTIVSSSYDGSIVHWDTEDHNFEALSRILSGTGGTSITALAAPQGTFASPTCMVLCGISSGNVIAVNCESGMQTALYIGHRASVTCIAVFEDFLFSAAEDEVVNVWKVGSGRFVKSIRTGSVVCGLHCHPDTRSLWVGYRSGLLERWSTEPEDDFGVEQVVDQYVGKGLISLQCVGAVDTLKVLTLSSNGINKVWCSHFNRVEQEMRHAIESLKAVITEDAREVEAWKVKASIATVHFRERRVRIVEALAQKHALQLCLRYWEMWRRARLAAFRKTRRNRIVAEMVAERRQYVLRFYYSTWYRLHMLLKQRVEMHRHAVALKYCTTHDALARFFRKWKSWHMRKQGMAQRTKVMRLMQLAGEKGLRSRYLHAWLIATVESRQRKTRNTQHLEMMKQAVLDGRRRAALQQWEAVRSRRAARHFQQHLIIALARVNQERHVQVAYNRWQRIMQRRRRLKAQQSLAALLSAQVDHGRRVWGFWQWMECVYVARHRVQADALRQLEADLRSEEAANSDLLEKLEVRKKTEQLRVRLDKEMRKYDDQQKHLNLLRGQRDALLAEHPIQRLGKDSAMQGEYRKYQSTLEDIADGPAEAAEMQGGDGSASSLVPLAAAETQRRVIELLPDEEASLALAMSMIKARVLNLYTDLPLLRQIRERVRKGTPAFTIFVESHSEIKRVAVEMCRRTLLATTARWPLTADLVQAIPAHNCTVLLAAIKSLAVAYDLIDPDTRASLGIGKELVHNVDWIVAMARVCYSKRKPALPSFVSGAAASPPSGRAGGSTLASPRV